MVGEKRGPGIVLILTLITCGIYYIIWVYTVSMEERANLNDESIEPGMDLFLIFITCGIYNFIWMYRQGERLQRLNEKKGIQMQDEGMLFMLLSIMFFPLMIYVIQDKLNRLY